MDVGIENLKMMPENRMVERKNRGRGVIGSWSAVHCVPPCLKSSRSGIDFSFAATPRNKARPTYGRNIIKKKINVEKKANLTLHKIGR